MATAFTTSAYHQAFNWYFGGAMEAYGVNTCSQYPSSGGVEFNQVHVYGMNGTESTPRIWNYYKNMSDPQCNINVGSPMNDMTIITFYTH